ncbi:MAG: hypothetical protein WEB00_10095 [Dehalococcoidia bacterium]
MTRFYAETDPAIGDRLTEPTDQLAYFLSFAVAERYGAQHDLARAANLIKIRHKVDMNTLLNFIDRNVETAQELEAFQNAAWQEPEPLANTVRSVIDVIGSDEKVAALLEPYPQVVPSLEELFEICLSAMENGALVRLSFDLEPPELKEPQVFGDGS